MAAKLTKNDLLAELISDLKAQIRQASNQAANAGKITMIDALRAAEQSVTLIEHELRKKGIIK